MARTLRPVDDLIAPAIHATINALQTGPEDSGAVQLAHIYAKRIDDDPESLEQIGPKLLAVLESLGATPKGRSLLKAPAGGAKGGKLAAVRNARAS